MGLLAFLLLGVVLGVLCYLVVKFVPMAPPWPTVLPIVACVVWLLILLYYMLGPIGDVTIPRLR
jgi:hypothetical protein